MAESLGEALRLGVPFRAVDLAVVVGPTKPKRPQAEACRLCLGRSTLEQNRGAW